ncbi:MAG: D-hexose-6-phosphate mutarotase [Victivallaceae bacterium]|nr:D-hexose-6-phosphate mutarotase [Victivallaceae bacterium]
MTVQELNTEFDVPDILFYNDSHGLVCAELSNAGSKAVIALHGAHLMSYVPKGQRDVLWMSGKSYFAAGKPIRGGIPVCWPWFGGHPSDPAMPSHGFARLAEWEVIAAGKHEGATFIELVLTPGLIPEKFRNGDFLVKLRVELGGKLSAALIIDNTDVGELAFSAALHSYFNISEIADIAVSGLDGKTFIDTLDDTLHVQKGDIGFTAETDLVYLDTEGACIIDDPGFGRRIRIAKCGSRSTVVWNPWKAKSVRMPDFGDEEYHSMVCVETTNAETDARILAPGESHTLQVIIESETQD